MAIKNQLCRQAGLADTSKNQCWRLHYQKQAPPSSVRRQEVRTFLRLSTEQPKWSQDNCEDSSWESRDQVAHNYSYQLSHSTWLNRQIASFKPSQRAGQPQLGWYFLINLKRDEIVTTNGTNDDKSSVQRILHLIRDLISTESYFA